MGDFSKPLGNYEKNGNPQRSDVSFHDFRRMVSTSDFTDLKTVGDHFS